MTREKAVGKGELRCPSIIDTPANRAAMPTANHDAWPKVADIARTYVFLAGPRSGLTNGASIPV
jgi:hypothetical protein